MKPIYIIILSLITTVSSFAQAPAKKEAGWETVFGRQLPLLGHRNWILVVDKAFPAQTAAGIEVLYTHEDLLTVARKVMDKIEASDHVKPIIYIDKEFDFLSNTQVPGLDLFRTQHKDLLKGKQVQTLLHESVFNKIDEASKLFKIIILKTDCLVPYSSVFIELDCKYWSDQAEKALRAKMEGK